ncbi:MAG: hypothetical protein HYY06_17360 [Deltaproteobacteria bacterium]|nr:hypothetical protein [Deltaproteobacteria bacterium]
MPRGSPICLLVVLGCNPSAPPPAPFPAATPAPVAPPAVGPAPAPASPAAGGSPSDAPVPQPMPIAVGQWVRLRVVRGARTAEMTYKIVGEEGGAWWFEVEGDTPGGALGAKLLVSIPDRTRPESIEMRRMLTRFPNGRVTEMTGPMLAAGQAAYRELMQSIAVGWQGLPQEDVTVPAGTFRACYKRAFSSRVLGIAAEGTSWHHSSVPINGMVKQVTSRGSMELVAFGTTGAAASFLPEVSAEPAACRTDADCPRLACGPCTSGTPVPGGPQPLCAVNPCPGAVAVCRPDTGRCVVR